MADIKATPATGKLGILTPGLGAVATTFIAGCIAVRRGLGQPIGAFTQMGTVRLGKHDLFKQFEKLKNTIRHIGGETIINHLGLDYYE